MTSPARSGRVRKNNSITRIPARRLSVQSGCGTFYTRLWTLGRLYQSLPNYRTSWRHIVTRCGEFTPSCGVSLWYDTIRNAILTCTQKQREFYCPPQLTHMDDLQSWREASHGSHSWWLHMWLRPVFIVRTALFYLKLLFFIVCCAAFSIHIWLLTRGAESSFPGGNTGGGICGLWLLCWD